MIFSCLFAVADIHKARAFYEDLFHLTVSDDYGRMISFDCGLVLQQDFDWLTGIPKAEMKKKENNCEIYFETKDFDTFLQKLKSHPEIDLLHPSREMPWGQRVIRFYDPDQHLIEVGESMKSVAEKHLASGMTLEEAAARMDVKVPDVQKMLNEAD